MSRGTHGTRSVDRFEVLLLQLADSETTEIQNCARDMLDNARRYGSLAGHTRGSFILLSNKAETLIGHSVNEQWIARAREGKNR